MRYFILSGVLFGFLFSVSGAADTTYRDDPVPMKIKSKVMAEPMTYEEVEAYCVEDGDEFWIPHYKLLAKLLILDEDLHQVDRWFWSSSIPEEGCASESCHIQVYSKTQNLRAAQDSTKTGHALCVSY